MTSIVKKNAVSSALLRLRQKKEGSEGNLQCHHLKRRQ
jgi:hypothetical protein